MSMIDGYAKLAQGLRNMGVAKPEISTELVEARRKEAAKAPSPDLKKPQGFGLTQPGNDDTISKLSEISFNERAAFETRIASLLTTNEEMCKVVAMQSKMIAELEAELAKKQA